MTSKIQNIFDKISNRQDINDFELKYIVNRRRCLFDFLDQFPSQVNISSFNSQNSLLHFCSDYDSALLLLDRGALIDAKNRLNQTPLLICPSSSVADLLIQRGASIKTRDLFGRNQLHFCSDIHKIEFFIDAGVYPNSKDHDGRTPLFYSNLLNVVQCLLDNNCNLRIRDKFLNTPLFYLSNPAVLQALIDEGLNVNATNHFKKNALFYNQSLPAIHVLLRNNININQVDTFGRKAFHYNFILQQIYDQPSDSFLHSLSSYTNFSKQQIYLSEKYNKFNYFYDRASGCYTLKKFNSQTFQMNPDFNQFYLNNNIPAYFSSQQSPQSPSPRSSSTAATSHYNFDNFNTSQLEREQPGGRFLWNDDLLEQAAEYMYNKTSHNSIKRTAQKFNVINCDLEEYYNEYIERMNNDDEFSNGSFHGHAQFTTEIDDNLSIYPSEDDDFVKSVP